MPQSNPCASRLDPGGLVAAIPSLLGFAPRDSLVVLVLSRGLAPQIGACSVLRVDLDGLGESALAGMRPLLARASSGEQGLLCEFVLVVLGEGGGRPHDMVAEGRTWCARVEERALPRGTRLAGALWASSTAPGARWQSLVGLCPSGLVPDPRTHPFALSGVARGDVLAPSREELRAQLASDERDRVRVSRAARRIARAHRGERAWQSRVAAAAEREMLEMLETITPPQSSTTIVPNTIAPGEAARFAVALRERGVRDRMVSATASAAMSAGGAGAELLWARLVQMLPDDARAEAAVLLGLSCYLRGRATAARVAFEVALEAEPAHKLAQLLDACLFAGVRPAELRVLAEGVPLKSASKPVSAAPGAGGAWLRCRRPRDSPAP